MLGRLFTIGLASAVFAAAGSRADIDHVSRDGVWSQLDQMPPDVLNGTPWIRPSFGQSVMLDAQALADALRGVPLEGSPDEIAPIVLWFPRPDGSFERFYVVESPIMTPDFQAARPDIKTYMGWGIDDPYATTRFDKTPEGFHAQIFTVDGAWYIDPYTKGDSTFYTSYFKRDYVKLDNAAWACEAVGEPVLTGGGSDEGSTIGERALVTRREYRLALAGTGEYTAVFAQPGDTDVQKKARAQAAMVTSINRVNQVYETEVGVRLNLINNTTIIYTAGGSDPYTNNNGGTMLGQNQTTIDTNIGSANYDIGHVFSTGGGGVAQLGVVCSNGNKAKGVTGSPSPMGDGYDIDYVAHEMGHQFNAPHTFAGVNGACSGNGSAGNFYEVGSGSTVMSYAGICGSDDLQAHSDPYFHHSSILVIAAFVASGGGSSCDAPVATTNNIPTATAGSNFTIPVGTPFFLTPATSSDADADALVYEWEQRDSVQRARPTTDPGTGAIFRPRVPAASATQYFPPLANVLAGTLSPGDVYPATNRTMNFRLTVRDRKVGGGGTFNTTSNRVITSTTTAGPFVVTAPNTLVTITGGNAGTVTWNVANTSAAPVNCANVDILLSIDSGATFPTVLASAVPNSGSAVVTYPNTPSNGCRVMVRGSGHIFYDVSNINFRIIAGSSPPNTPTNVAANPSDVCPGQTTQLSATVGGGEVVDWYTGSCGGTLVGTGNPLVVTPPGSTTYFARARRTSDAQVSANCGSVGVTQTPNPVAPTSATTDRNNFCADDSGNITLTAVGGSGTTARWFSGSCGGSLVGTGSPLVIASPSSSTTYFVRWETTCGNSTCASVAVNVLSLAVAPSSVTSDRLQVCPNDPGSITLTAIGGSGVTLNWYSGVCGGTFVGSGSPLTIPAPLATTDYYARWNNACGNSACAPFVTVAVGPPASDFDGDGTVDFFDYDTFVACFEGGACPPGKTADFDGDGTVDFFDYDAFVIAFEIGC
ncbi:MAG: zinc-dependent metalloprotease family protein [Planctomycetota bacterium]